MTREEHPKEPGPAGAEALAERRKNATYIYFVAYNASQIIGNIEIFRDTPIVTFADVRETEQAIAAAAGIPARPGAVLITNWILLKQPETVSTTS